jgi:murein DD-endopeptidase MepM/ murein hydrolase activator NlpD
MKNLHKNLDSTKNLKPGTFIKRGTVIGYVGNSGTSQAGTTNGSHLHFEIRVNDHYLGEGMNQKEAGKLYSTLLRGKKQ